MEGGIEESLLLVNEPREIDQIPVPLYVFMLGSTVDLPSHSTYEMTISSNLHGWLFNSFIGR